MADLALVLVIFALCGLVGFQEFQNRKERSKLINALVSRTPEQLRDLEFMDKVEVKIEKPEVPDLVPTEQLSDEEFAEKVGAGNG